MRNVHNLQEGGTMYDVGKNIPKIYASLDKRQVDHQSNMIEVEDKIVNQPIAILINFGASHS